MAFNSLSFLVFFVIVMFLHHQRFSWRVKKTNLLLASYVFYAAWNPPFLLLLWISTLTDWFAAKKLRNTAENRKKFYVVLSVVINLSLLAYFKYTHFIHENIQAILEPFGLMYPLVESDLILPLGISFYTFQSMSYTIDVYRGKIPPSKSLLDFALYVTFFPQLVAGPIVRARDFLRQCWTETQVDRNDIGWGMSLLTLGLFQKIVLADALLSPVVEKVYGAAADASFLDAWLGTLAFSGQIFFDFSGYSLIAIGIAMGLGFALPDNFRFPYAAIGLSDFWRRWHISLSSWLRDYLYISLSGNRKGSLRTCSNLMLTMLLGGLWHGASWLFVLWGGLHGLYLICERLLTRRFGHYAIFAQPATQYGLGLLTYMLVCISWVFFRADDLPTALQLIRTMFVYRSHLHLLQMAEALRVAVVIVGLVLCHWYLKDTTLEDAVHNASWWSKSLALSSLLVCIILAAGDARAFIYFDF